MQLILSRELRRLYSKPLWVSEICGIYKINIEEVHKVEVKRIIDARMIIRDELLHSIEDHQNVNDST